MILYLPERMYKMLKFRKFSEFPRGTLYDLLQDAYSYDSRNKELWDENWHESDEFFYDNPEIADKYGLKVIYDAAHAFGVEVNGESILNAGDMSTLSFHATKVYNTIEGGAMIMHDEKTKKRIDYLKNFGFAGETEVVGPGINSKMDEMRSAYGLLNLKQVDAAIEVRHQVAIKYREALRNVEGITFFDDMPGVRHNYSYFPIFIDAQKYGMTRVELYMKMKSQNVLGRRYFYPLISEFSTYRGLESADPTNLPNAHKMADSVICLPMHHALSDEDIQRTLDCILK